MGQPFLQGMGHFFHNEALMGDKQIEDIGSSSLTPTEIASASSPLNRTRRCGAKSVEERILPLLLFLLTIGLRFWVLRETHSTGEDFFITLRYAQNIAAGHGFAYNPGEHVLGTTTPLYTLILALFLWLHLPAIFLGKLLNILADGLTTVLLLEIGKSVRARGAGLLAGTLYAFSGTAIGVSISGMETALVTCVGAAAILVFLKREKEPTRFSAIVLCGLAAILFLLRIDGLVLGGLLLLADAIRVRRAEGWAVLLGLAIALPWVVFAFFYFGSPLPSSVVAKLTVYRVTMDSSHKAILQAFITQFAKGLWQKLLTLLFLVGVGVCFGEKRWGLLVALGWLTVYYGTMFVSSVPAFGWYFLPPWPLYLFLAALGAWFIGCTMLRPFHNSERDPRFLFWKRSLLGGTAALVCLLGTWHLPTLVREIQKPQMEEDAVLRPTGLWFRQHAGPHQTILLEPIGTIGYYSQRPILDMIGLVSPQVLPCYRTKGPLACIVARFHPTWLCLRINEAVRLQQEAPELLAADYRLVHVVSWRHASSPIFLLFQARSF